LRERWRIPKALRGSLIARLGRIVEGTESDPREVISAAKAVLSASKINLENISVAVQAIEQLNLEARLTELERTYEEQQQGWPG
jgi:hypothetical protein